MIFHVVSLVLHEVIVLKSPFHPLFEFRSFSRAPACARYIQYTQSIVALLIVTVKKTLIHHTAKRSVSALKFSKSVSRIQAF